MLPPLYTLYTYTVMGIFSLHDATRKYGLVIDIGSGSVLVSIVASEVSQLHPIILWAKREYVPLSQTNSSLEQTAKAVMTALMNALLEFESSARGALRTYDPNGKISIVQVAIAAPWSYTVTKSISYTKTDPFALTKELVESLVDAARKKIETELHENEQASSLSLTIMQRTVLSVIANGYTVTAYKKQPIVNLSVVYASTITQDILAATVVDIQKKIAPKAKLQPISFMLAFQHVRKQLKPHWHEVCLIDVTYEATEIGLVREGSLHYSTHAPIGSRTIARVISNVTDIPISDIFSRMQTLEGQSFLLSFSTEQHTVVAEIIESFEEKMVELFMETGDVFAIPKQLLLHTEQSLEKFFSSILLNAAKKTTKTSHHIAFATSIIIDEMTKHTKEKRLEPILLDTAMLVSAIFFHTSTSNTSLNPSLDDILQ